MKIVTLMENTAGSGDIAAEHGLSLYIETGERRILFDAGQSSGFADNAQKLGIDLAEVDAAVLSHGHYDHGGGLKTFLERNGHAPVWVNPHAFEPHYNGESKDIGLPQELEKSGRIRFARDGQRLAEGLTLYSHIAVPFGIQPFGLTVRQNGSLQPEDFRHEQYLLAEENGKRILFSGCSHRGILNIAAWFRPDVLVGGFHFMKLDPDGSGREALDAAARRLLAYPTVYYTGHCTGAAQYDFLKKIMGDRLCPLSGGTVIEV